MFMCKEWVQLYLYSPTTPSWRGAQLKHRDNFTFTFAFTLQSHHLPGGTGKDYQTPQSEEAVSVMRSEHRTSRIWNRNTNRYTVSQSSLSVVKTFYVHLFRCVYKKVWAELFPRILEILWVVALCRIPPFLRTLLLGNVKSLLPRSLCYGSVPNIG
jgi:hypothetical protein